MEILINFFSEYLIIRIKGCGQQTLMSSREVYTSQACFHVKIRFVTPGEFLWTHFYQNQNNFVEV